MAIHPSSKTALFDIVAAASTLDERLRGGLSLDDTKNCEEFINARLEAWRDVVAKGDLKRFQRRLAWDGLTPESVRHVLGSAPIREDCPLPAWADLLQTVLQLSCDLSEPDSGEWAADCKAFPFLDPEQPLPFEEILLPFVIVASQELATRTSAATCLLAGQAHATLQRDLLQTLTSHAAQAFSLEFSLTRAREQDALERLVEEAIDSKSSLHYQRFVWRMQQGGLVDFFREYPVLARLLSTITLLWIEANAEFLQRLLADWSDIQRISGYDGDTREAISAIQPSLSDPHRGRRSVYALTLRSGYRLIYKPKDLGTEEIYQQVLAWLNERGLPLPFKVLTVLNRSSYGWVEFVEHSPCQDQEEIRRYYQRAGMLLCLIYALEGTDYHYENIIACGEYPVLVDMETLMQHWPCYEEVDDGMRARFQAQKQIRRSVLRTGLLPDWQIHGESGAAYDLSGLGDASEQEFSFYVTEWQHINTDRMKLVSRSCKLPESANVPLLRGAPVGLAEYVEEIVTGFRQMYHFLQVWREELLAEESPLCQMAHQPVRFIYRNTWVYGVLARQSLNPRYLRDGIARSIHFEQLCRAVLPVEGPLQESEEPSPWWTIFAAERRAMEQADIPFFTAYANDLTLFEGPAQPIEGCLQESGFALVVERLQMLNAEDLEQQIRFILSSLYAHVARKTSSEEVAQEARPDASAKIPTSAELAAQALKIAEQIASQAIRAQDGSVTWITPQYLARSERYQLQPLDYDLYSGACGVALFLAAVEKIMPGSGYRELALGALLPLRQVLLHSEQHLTRTLGIGGCAGLASLVYTLTRAGKWLDEPSLVEDARRAASLITRENIARDTALDIMGGAAGSILGLLALYEETGDDNVLEQAITCGRHLLQARVVNEEGYRIWPTFAGKMLAGFSHGAAGITYALLRLYTFTGEADLLEAAAEGIAWEDRLFVPEARNWVDLREQKQPAFAAGWCHGAPGIGLARLGGLPALATPQVHNDIEVALETAQRYAGAQDHLCCGLMGRVAIVLTASRKLSRPDLAEIASRRAWEAVQRAEQTGTFLLHSQLPRQVYVPGLFQGTSGIGYTLLRLAYLEKLPEVLLWE